MKNKNLKIESIKFKNHVHLHTIQCEFNNTFTELIGVNGSGKTTFINALWMAIKGIALKGTDCIIGDRFQFIQNGKKSMDVEVALIDEANNNAKIIIKRHVLKNTSKLTFKAPDDYPISHEWLNNLLSVSFLSAKNFTQKNKKEQALLLGIDTSEYDDQLKELKGLYTLLNRQYKAMGESEVVEKVEAVNIQELIENKSKLQENLADQYRENQAHNEKLRKSYDDQKILLQKECETSNLLQSNYADAIRISNKSLNDLRDLGYEGNEVKKWIDSLPLPCAPQIYDDLVKQIPEPEYIKEMPDTTAIKEFDEQIADASIINQKASEYNKYLDVIKERENKKLELEQNQIQQQDIQQKKIKYIQSQNLKFDGLEIDDDGGLLLAGREIREPYFSKGELEKIVVGLRASLDDDLKIIFIDDFDLLDEQNQKEIPEDLISKGFQVIVAKVGRAVSSKNVIALSEIEIETQPKEQKPKLIG